MPAAGSAALNTPARFQSEIDSRTARIGVIGLGYVGLPLVLLFSGEKFAITGFDIDSRKVDTLTQGGSYIVRIEPQQVQSARDSGFTATTELSRIAEMDAVIICVGRVPPAGHELYRQDG
jgi:UDP-N-acetyl-D-glucosamine dehydrogenase